jgi:hypothetical protein
MVLSHFAHLPSLQSISLKLQFNIILFLSVPVYPSEHIQLVVTSLYSASILTAIVYESSALLLCIIT